ncbi:hypothetical protein [Ostreibacterium oceani]|uniref:Lipoprotein n=1 Tax=Ostreibacterium oceani TaxID=2654998 RepID=A0A6N7ESI0_9GAMM|nr:hypothetical protein [Ostreibacterium oceani]MPV85501.1 hypothetical protein [Ostreibacterium oceani]
MKQLLFRGLVVLLLSTATVGCATKISNDLRVEGLHLIEADAPRRSFSPNRHYVSFQVSTELDLSKRFFSRYFDAAFFECSVDQEDLFALKKRSAMRGMPEFKFTASFGYHLAPNPTMLVRSLSHSELADVVTPPIDFDRVLVPENIVFFEIDVVDVRLGEGRRYKVLDLTNEAEDLCFFAYSAPYYTNRISEMTNMVRIDSAAFRRLLEGVEIPPIDLSE